MFAIRRVVGNLLLCSALLGTQAAWAVLPSPRATWRELQSPNFLFVGDVSARTLAGAAENLELFRAALARLAPVAGQRPALPTTVLLLDTAREFRIYAQSDTPADDIAAIFHPTAWGSYMVMNAARGDDALDLVYPGYVHQVIAQSFAGTPLWLNSGLSEFYRTFRATAKTIEIGRPARHHVEALREHGRIPLARLLAIDYQSAEYRDAGSSDAFFAESWALVHYLLVGEPALAPRVPDLLERLGRGEAVESALRGALGFGVAELENRLVSYAQRSIFRYATWPRGDLAAPDLPAPSELPRAAALALAGEYLAHVGAFPEAREHLDEAVKLGGETGDTLALAAYAAEKAERYDEARTLYARALALPMRRVSSPAHAARFALDHPDTTGGGGAGASSRLEMAGQAVERALELDPDYGEAWAIKGYVALSAGDPTSALVALAEAERRLPGRQDVVYNRFRAAVAAGLTVVARGIATGPLARLDPEAGARAVAELVEREQGALVEQAVTASNRALAEERYQDALTPLREAVPRITDPLRKAELAERLTDLERYVAQRERVDRYNRAVALSNEGKLREARELVEQVLDGCGAEMVCPSARELADWLDRRRGKKR